MAGFCSYFGVVYRRAFLGLIVLGAGLLACAEGSRSKIDSHVLRELKQLGTIILPARHEDEGLPPIQVIVAAGGPIMPYRPDEQ